MEQPEKFSDLVDELFVAIKKNRFRTIEEVTQLIGQHSYTKNYPQDASRLMSIAHSYISLVRSLQSLKKFISEDFEGNRIRRDYDDAIISRYDEKLYLEDLQIAFEHYSNHRPIGSNSKI